MYALSAYKPKIEYVLFISMLIVTLEGLSLVFLFSGINRRRGK